jgi:SAM-dependent methyltransferase
MNNMGREQRHWEALAATDPMWVILTEPGREGRWDAEEFFQSGRDEMAKVFDLLTDLGLLPKAGTAVDFGCGLGRLTETLAQRFDHAHGIDISASMIEQARAHNRFGARVEYHVNPTDALPMLGTGTVDFLYSRIALQHIPRPAAERYIAEFGRVLAPDGVAVFQLLTRAKSPFVRIRHRLRDAAPDAYRSLRDFVSKRARWEMNTVPERRVRQILAGVGMEIRTAIDDGAGGKPFDSRLFVAVRS